jgi:hypothetical protein
VRGGFVRFSYVVMGELALGGLLVVWVVGGLGCWWFGLLVVWFPAAFATAGLASDIFFIFIDPCAGRHLLLLLRQKK